MNQEIFVTIKFALDNERYAYEQKLLEYEPRLILEPNNIVISEIVELQKKQLNYLSNALEYIESIRFLT